MIKRTVDISEPAFLRLRKNQLLVEKDGELAASIPVEDLGVLILQHPAISLTQSLVIACQQNNTVIVFCDRKYLPYSVLLPISEGHSLHSKILQQQIAVSKPSKKQLWQQVIRHKITQQADTLERLDMDARALHRMLPKVKSGDKENHEAQAAQLYWHLLMGNRFRRDPNAEGLNALLNYGYAIIRSMIARALVSSGLHPALGLHHRNQYNGLCLADDLMEPFRPWVDLLVQKIAETDPQPEVCREHKQPLLELLNEQVQWKDGRLPLMVASHHLAADFKSVLFGESKRLDIPVRMSAN